MTSRPTRCPEAKLTSMLPELQAIRHDLHAHPELGFEEFRTSALVRRELEALGLQGHTSAETGIWVDLRPDLRETSKTIALRADLDALPMHESTPLPYRSTYPGKAHKCGHDGHTTILLGVARMLAPQRDSLNINVRLIFQPAEEGVRGGGAKVMVAEGVLDGVSEIYGLHNWPDYPFGELRVASGPVMAELCEVNIRVRGQGGHGSQPQRCRDPIAAAAALVVSTEGLARHCGGHSGGAVLSITQFHGGDANNVIPQDVTLAGSLRFVDQEVGDHMKEALRKRCQGIALSREVEVDCEILAEYPLLVNEAKCAERVQRVATTILGAEAVSGRELPMAGGEDFAYFAQQCPAAYFFLGAGTGEGPTPGCHHPDFDFDDRLIEIGVKVFCGIVADCEAAEPASADPSARL